MLDKINDVYYQGSADALTVMEEITGISKIAMAERLEKTAGIGNLGRKVKGYFSSKDIAAKEMDKGNFFERFRKSSLTGRERVRKESESKARKRTGLAALSAAGISGAAGAGAYYGSKDNKKK